MKQTFEMTLRSVEISHHSSRPNSKASIYLDGKVAAGEENQGIHALRDEYLNFDTEVDEAVKYIPLVGKKFIVTVEGAD